MERVYLGTSQHSRQQDDCNQKETKKEGGDNDLSEGDNFHLRPFHPFILPPLHGVTDEAVAPIF